MITIHDTKIKARNGIYLTAKEASDFMSKTYPGQIVNHYFKQNSRKFNSYTEEEITDNPKLKEEAIGFILAVDKIKKTYLGNIAKNN